MLEDYFPRKFQQPMNISTFARLGVSQASFLSEFKDVSTNNFSRQQPDQTGYDLDINKINGWMEENHKFSLLNIRLGDMNNNFVGKLNRLEFVGTGEYGNKQISFSHNKMPSTGNPKFFDDYKIQLATYAFCLKNHPVFKHCDILDAKIIIKYPGSEDVKNEFVATVQKLEEWIMYMPNLIETACKLISGEVEPKNEYYSLERKHWVSNFAPKYKFSIN
ncbi:MAG: hypothetical protein HYT71_03745 [Candidatus Aenigmarchaeota archaeon]|nr:hypothetical protein [Candidatus Aenigmarchaeota archaeon]